MLFSIMEMFISFFSGKVMLFYGITLIMKEKSNASALRPRVDDIVKDFWNPQCCFPIIKVLFGIKAVYLRRVFKIQKIMVGKEALREHSAKA